MSGQNWATIVAAVLAVVAAGYTGRVSLRAKRIDVEAHAYERAQDINKETVDDLRTEIGRLKNDLTEVRADMAKTQQRAAATERQNAILRRLLIQHVPGINIADFT